MEKLINTNLITNYMKENNLSKTAFCKLCKINLSTLNKILDNNPQFRIRALYKISRQLHLNISEIFRF